MGFTRTLAWFLIEPAPSTYSNVAESILPSIEHQNAHAGIVMSDVYLAYSNPGLLPVFTPRRLAIKAL
jgi:hypothetical protein